MAKFFGVRCRDGNSGILKRGMLLFFLLGLLCPKLLFRPVVFLGVR